MTILMINVNYVDIKREIKYLKLALNDLLVQVKVELFFSQCNNCLFLLLMYVNNKFLKCSKECFCTSINKHWPKMNNRKLSHWCFKILLNHPNHISASEYLQWAHFFMLSLVQKACFDTLITFFFYLFVMATVFLNIKYQYFLRNFQLKMKWRYLRKNSLSHY